MINKKVVIVTGAAKGIGRATALQFASNGYCVALVDNDHPSLTEAGQEIELISNPEYLLLYGDIAEADFLQTVIAETFNKWGRIDVLVNNAAWRTIETMRNIEVDVWEKTLKICLTAPAFLSKWSAAKMEELQLPGVIINISSMMSERPAGNSPAYIAAKGALESLTRELAVTYGRSGIRVLSVRLGVVDTSMSHDYTNQDGNNISGQLIEHLVNATPLNRGGRPEEVADAVYWLCTDAASFITGTSLLIDGGFSQNMNSYAMKKLQFPNEY